MSDEERPTGTGSSRPGGDTARLLELALRRRTTAIEELGRRLAAPDGAAWLAQAIDRCGDVGASSRLLRGDLSVAALEALKDQGKDRFVSRDPDERLAGAAAYFFSIAGALLHRKRLITDRPRDRIDDMLLDLATDAPSPWAELLGRAALTPHDILEDPDRGESRHR